MRSLLRRGKGLSCEQVMEVLQSYLDGETDAETARGVAGHLEDCSDCNTESMVYSNIKGSLNARPETIDPEILANLRSFGERIARGEIET